MDFETLKSSSSNFDKLTKALETNLILRINQTKTNTKTTDFETELDKTGNGYVVIRFLPLVSGEDLLGKEYGLQHFRVQVVGILKTH